MKKLLEEIFSLYYKDVYHYLLSLCHDSLLAEDLTSEVFVEVVRSIAGFRQESDLRTWLYTIARRRWYNHLKRKKQQPPILEIQEYQDGLQTNLEEEAQNREAAAYVRKLMAEEPVRSQQIFRLRMEGFSFYEIGKKLGLSENSARVIHFRLRSKLRKLLTEGGFDNDAVKL